MRAAERREATLTLLLAMTLILAACDRGGDEGSFRLVQNRPGRSEAHYVRVNQDESRVAVLAVGRNSSVLCFETDSWKPVWKESVNEDVSGQGSIAWCGDDVVVYGQLLGEFGLLGAGGARESPFVNTGLFATSSIAACESGGAIGVSKNRSAGRAEFHVWMKSTPGQRQTFELEDFKGSGYCSAVMGLDGNERVVGCIGGSARVWDLRSGRSVAETTVETDAISLVKWLGDGRVGLVGRDGRCFEWEIATGSVKPGRLLDTSRLRIGAWSVDGRRLAVALGRQVYIYRWRDWTKAEASWAENETVQFLGICRESVLVGTVSELTVRPIRRAGGD